MSKTSQNIQSLVISFVSDLDFYSLKILMFSDQNEIRDHAYANFFLMNVVTTQIPIWLQF